MNNFKRILEEELDEGLADEIRKSIKKWINKLVGNSWDNLRSTLRAGDMVFDIFQGRLNDKEKKKLKKMGVLGIFNQLMGNQEFSDRLSDAPDEREAEKFVKSRIQFGLGGL